MTPLRVTFFLFLGAALLRSPSLAAQTNVSLFFRTTDISSADSVQLDRGLRTGLVDVGLNGISRIGPDGRISRPVVAAPYSIDVDARMSRDSIHIRARLIDPSTTQVLRRDSVVVVPAALSDSAAALARRLGRAVPTK